MYTDPHGVLELTRRLKREPNIETAIHIMQWELGDLAKATMYTKWHDPDLALAYKAEAKKALSDLIFQVYVVAALLEISPTDLTSMGIETVRGVAMDIDEQVGRLKHYRGDK